VPIAHLAAGAGPDDVAALIGRDGAVIVDAVAPEALLDRIESELRPYLDANADRAGRLQRRPQPAAPALSSPARPAAGSW